ncbi:hypothetical protein [Desulfosporosinus acidiphilus]|uniref:hypothetical protein n=1 Tax=Desulfosporosinus acidiphilus TaxID=885581 RepID=UPI000257AB49|nr:hypothetical protein [Desulfosporosinus acidiphilus]
MPERTYNHIACRIEDEELDYYDVIIRELGLELRHPRSRVDGEGRSLYFYNFDKHLLELHTGTHSERLSRYSLDACERA